ncbi:neutral/alkaline non-lysosomal ceramidase N-terminal domain-containing protein [Natronoglomus mannanivorans]|uniref:Neutral/alkaline non-lysosomal ceramidase N-terminal domain-containing protein n=1 Tax=Natronoglomus mannanivorans TaxID=2979990 RepID=A0AAP2Z2L3_9EURY|nr:neutral/alkaline non-lysosomal ceramidase N-terminal domain-containing protein [Halobacteria archaeon AArc-xg1-1]
MSHQASETTSDGDEWRAGTATRAITPDEPMWMAGFAKRDEPADGVVHDLEAKALALEDETGRLAAIVTVDVLFVPREIRETVTSRCESRYGVDPDALMITATHTHCGPEFRDFKLRMYADEDGPYRERGADYRDRLEDELVSVVGEALDDRTAATISYSHARCGFAMNRRLPVEDGIAHVQNPYGPVDPEVPVLVVEGAAGDGDDDGREADSSPQAIVFGYACHTTTIFGTKYCGDWAGFARRYVEEEYPDATALFLIGCAGDQNPYPRRELELAKRHGRTMATAVRAAVESRRHPVRGPLRTHFVDQEIAFEEPPDRAELESMREADERYLRVRAETLLTELEETGTIQTEHPYPVQAFGFGDDLTLVGLGGEVLVEYGLQLKERLEGLVWIAAYANDEFTYVPTAQARYEGGYEGEDVILRTPFSGPLEPDVEERILRRVEAAAERVRGGRTVR